MNMSRGVKYSGVKIVPHSDLRAGTTSREPNNRRNNIRILQWNAGGLTQAKRIELNKILFDKDIDIFFIQEANLTIDQLKYFNFTGFILNLLPKNRQISSGILVGVKKDIKSSFQIVKEMDNTDKSELVKLDFWDNKTHLHLYSIYNPPRNEPDLSLIEQLNKTVIIGDFNAHSKRWGYEKVDSTGKIMEEFLNTSTFELIYSKEDPSTFIHYSGAGSNPDLLFATTDIAPKIKRQVIEDPSSGHRAIIADIKLDNKNVSQHYMNLHWNFKKADWKKYKMELENKFTEQTITQQLDQPDQMNKNFCKIILETAKKHIPRGRIKNYKPFWNPQLEELKKERDIARNTAEQTKTTLDTQIWRKKCALLKKEINIAKKNHFNNFLEKMDYRTDGPKAHKFIKNVKDKKEKSSTPIIHNNKILTNDSVIAKTFNKYYANSHKVTRNNKKEYKQFKKDLKQKRECDPNTQHNIFFQNFNMQELNIAINSLKTKKSPGPDHIHPEFIKNLGKIAKQQLLKLYNLSWKTNVPAEWRKAIIVPLLKKDKIASEIKNYRPIALTSIIVKVMERMISNRLNWFLESQNLISPCQAGFRELHSTNEQVLLLSQEIKNSFNRKEDTVAIFIDFQSAYDSICRTKLLKKVKEIGIQGPMFSWLCHFLTQRFIATRYGKNISKYKQVHCGLPQGAVLSTTLFNIFINDLPQKIQESGVKCALFADDLVMWTSKPKNKTIQLEKTMQQSLTNLQKWTKENLMTVNTTKSNYQIFSLRKNPLKIKLNFEGQQLSETKEAKYLGVIFDTKLTWTKQIENVIQRAERRLSLLKRLAGMKWGCSRTTLNMTYNVYIKPLFTYCNEVLVTANTRKIQTFQNQSLRLITGAIKTTPIPAMEILTNQYPVKYEIEKAALIQHEKLIRLPFNTWNKRNFTRTLKTQESFLSKIEDIKKNVNLPNSKENFIYKVNPTQTPNITYYLHMVQEVKKSDTPTNVLKLLALETIHTRFPEHEWLHIYTDGSLITNQDGAGAGVTCHLFSSYKSLGYGTTNFDGETEAIQVALQNLLYRISHFHQAVILSDSRAAIIAITSQLSPKNQTIIECWKILTHLTALKKHVVFQWIPAHCGLSGNDKADFLAKKGTKGVQKSIVKLPFYAAKRVINSEFKKIVVKYYSEESKNKRWDLPNLHTIIPEYPRKTAVATFRLITGHDCLAKHLNRIGIYPSPLCPLCDLQEEMDQDHLQICPATASVPSTIEKYWRARGLMTSLSEI